jgi:hypothetical protein
VSRHGHAGVQGSGAGAVPPANGGAGADKPPRRTRALRPIRRFDGSNQVFKWCWCWCPACGPTPGVGALGSAWGERAGLGRGRGESGANERRPAVRATPAHRCAGRECNQLTIGTSSPPFLTSGPCTPEGRAGPARRPVTPGGDLRPPRGPSTLPHVCARVARVLVAFSDRSLSRGGRFAAAVGPPATSAVPPSVGVGRGWAVTNPQTDRGRWCPS